MAAEIIPYQTVLLQGGTENVSHNTAELLAELKSGKDDQFYNTHKLRLEQVRGNIYVITKVSSLDFWTTTVDDQYAPTVPGPDDPPRTTAPAKDADCLQGSVDRGLHPDPTDTAQRAMNKEAQLLANNTGPIFEVGLSAGLEPDGVLADAVKGARTLGYDVDLPELKGGNYSAHDIKALSKDKKIALRKKLLNIKAAVKGGWNPSNVVCTASLVGYMGVRMWQPIDSGAEAHARNDRALEKAEKGDP